MATNVNPESETSSSIADLNPGIVASYCPDARRWTIVSVFTDTSVPLNAMPYRMTVPLSICVYDLSWICFSPDPDRLSISGSRPSSA